MNKKLSKELIKTLDNTFNRLLELSLNSSLSDEFFLNEWSKNRIILKDFLADEIARAENGFIERIIRQLKERKLLISKDGRAGEYIQELINDYESILELQK